MLPGRDEVIDHLDDSAKRPWLESHHLTFFRGHGRLVGVEMAQAFQTLGADVTLVEAAPRILPLEEEFACSLVMSSLQERGVRVLTGQTAERFAQSDGTVTVTTSEANTATATSSLWRSAAGQRRTTWASRPLD